MSKHISKNASKNLMNLIYKETSLNSLPISIPSTKINSKQQNINSKISTLSTQLYSNNEYNEQKEQFEFLKNIKLKQKQNSKLLLNSTNIGKLPLLTINLKNQFLTKLDFQNLLPEERYSKFDISVHDPFQIIKFRQFKTLEFNNEYLLIFENRLYALVFLEELQSKILNGIDLKFKFYEGHSFIFNFMISYPHQLKNETSVCIKDLNFQKTGSIDEILKIDKHNYKVLNHILQIDENSKSVIVKNWPFGLKNSTILKLLRNYNLKVDNPIETVFSNINLGINIIKLNFVNVEDTFKFWNDFNGLNSWQFLQLYGGRSIEKKNYVPLIVEFI
ncbi:uncharacterized protein KGF55_001320 [Candida pseudojiufengensis]|uniref:uncharacterized protein n=1 Tax=Candida pseudojiufengensis TaxID=497109 RepID=UPI002224E064|nr:uncharacterized protein KGF55_001320 [Candida pseudojiufengensis]KAI5965956.1 hypothetical protein KGF55_001320 [Candida pseudojiufengensis]